MRDAVVTRLREEMERAGLDAAVAVSPENFGWLAGFVVPSQPIMRWRHAMAIVGGGETAYVCVDMEETTVARQAGDVPVRAWGEFSDDAMAVLADELERLGLARARIGTEFDYLPAADFARLKAAMPEAEFVAIDAALDRMRRIKTPDEIDLLRRLSRISDKAIGDAFAAVSPGDTEMDLGAALTRSVYEQGAEQFRLMIVATGPRSELPNVGPTDRVLQPRDVCRVEIFSMIGGYHAGVCRTAVVSEPPEHAERIWANLVGCKHMLLDMIRPGAVARDIYAAFLAEFGKLGLPPIAFVGHGIGLNLHEAPYLAAHDDTVLEAGTVMGFEPLVYRTGYGYGMQLKDMVLVSGDGGADLLSDATDNNRLIVID